MALIGAYDDEPRGQNPNCRPGVQAYLAFLATQVRGEPGRPRVNAEPFEPVEALELVDGVHPEPEPPKRRRKPRNMQRASHLEEPTPDKELRLLARKLTGGD